MRRIIAFSTHLIAIALTLTHFHWHLSSAYAGFSDEFNSQELDPRWTVVMPNPASSVAMTGSALQMTASHQNGGSDYWGSNFAAPRILQPVSGDWEIEVKLTYPPTNNYQGAGILMLSAGDAPDSTAGHRIAEKAFRPDSGGKVLRSVGGYVGWADDAAYMKIKKEGDSYTGWISSNGTNWTQNGTLSDANWRDIAYVGLIALRKPWDGAPVNTVPVIDYFRITQFQPPCARMPDGLVAWWTGDGSADDALGNHDGLLADNTGFLSGQVDEAFSLDGADDAVTISASQTLALESFSMEAWVLPKTDTYGPVLEYNRGSDDAPSFGPHMGTLTNGVLFGNITDESQTYLETAGGAITLNQWNHIVFTYDKATGVETLYANGAYSTEKNVGTPTLHTEYPVYIGRRPASHNGPQEVASFNGLIDDVALYSRALSANEVEALYGAGSSGKCWPGDADGDGMIGLDDAILSLQAIAGLAPDHVQAGADVNNDGHIGLVEVLYILQAHAEAP